MPGTCTNCPKTNEYQDGPYLCYECKLVQPGSTKPSETKPVIGKNPIDYATWMGGGPEGFSAQTKRCKHCNNKAGHHYHSYCDTRSGTWYEPKS